MKKILASLLACCALSAAAQTEICINGKWKFYFAKDAETADRLTADKFYSPKYNTRDFDEIQVPSNWAVLGYEEPVYRGFSDNKAGEGLYVRHFTAPDSFTGSRVLLHFGGVWNSAEVWLNGHWLGRHDSGYTSFSYDVTDKLRQGDNTLAVRVRQVFPGYKTDTYDDWTLGGIYRDVTLESMPASRHIDRVRVETKMSGQVDVRVMVADEHKNTLPGNYMSPGKPYRLHLSLADRNGQVVAGEYVDVEGHPSNSRESRRSLQVAQPRLWTAETPYLYTLTVDLLEDGVPVQTCRQRIGIREISTAGGVFRINGQAVKLRGVNRHDEHPAVGRAVGREHWLEDLRLMKAAHINYVRACHYQHAKGFVELCDSMGMYVGEEISLGGADKLMYNPSFVGSAMLRTVETVERDINNPSVIYWSVGNEDSFTDMFLQCVRAVKGLDRTRPVLLPWNADETLPEEIDILAPHYWTAREYDSIASQSKRPIITTEYVHAYGNQRFGGLADCWQALTRHAAGAGGAVWMWADQGLRTPTPKDPKVYKNIERDSLYLRVSPAGWDGITDSYRHPLRDYQEVQAVYCPVRPAVAAVDLGQSVTIPVRNDYDFITTDGITADYRVFVDSKQTAKGTAGLSVRPHEQGSLLIPNTGIRQLRQGQTAYVQLTFRQADGSVMATQAVELTAARSPEPVAPRRLKLTVEQAERTLTVKAGRHAYVFSRSTGMPEGLRPTFWHQLNDGDQIIKGRINGEKYKTQDVVMDIRETADSIVVTTAALHVVNDSNTVRGTYTFTIGTDGTLGVAYSLTPRLTSTYVPVVGMALKARPERWLGLGPCDTYPNKQAAGVLGVYDATSFAGTRQARWLDVKGARILLDTPAESYIDRDSADADEVRLLSQVLGRSEKGRLNDRRYRVEPGRTYTGSFRLSPR